MFTKKILWFWLKSGSLDNLGNNKIDHIVAILLCNGTFFGSCQVQENDRKQNQCLVSLGMEETEILLKFMRKFLLVKSVAWVFFFF